MVTAIVPAASAKAKTANVMIFFMSAPSAFACDLTAAVSAAVGDASAAHAFSSDAAAAAAAIGHDAGAATVATSHDAAVATTATGDDAAGAVRAASDDAAGATVPAGDDPAVAIREGVDRSRKCKSCGSGDSRKPAFSSGVSRRWISGAILLPLIDRRL
jgi:hypothetical protein